MTELNFFIAFAAGLASFLAPCVIPLVPAYIGFISGVSFSDLTNVEHASHYRNKVLVNSLLYILGFSLVFVLLGLGATAIGKTLILNRLLFMRIGGLLVIIFGLYAMGLFNKFLFAQKEIQIQLPQSIRRLRYIGPFLMGTTFAVAWSPCVGPVLGAIITLAALTGDVFKGGSLLFVYSLGISLPFLIIALTLSHSYKLLKKVGPNLKYISFASGILLIAVGILMFSQKYDLVSGFILGEFYKLDFFKKLYTTF